MLKFLGLDANGNTNKQLKFELEPWEGDIGWDIGVVPIYKVFGCPKSGSLSNSTFDEQVDSKRENKEDFYSTCFIPSSKHTLWSETSK